MCNSPSVKDRMLIDIVNRKERIELKLSEHISLVHDVSIHSGKTTDMAKGLFLCCNGRLCAGESSGIGTPVWKTVHRTIFPTLVSAEAIGETAIEKVFKMDRVLVWHCAGKKMTNWFSRLFGMLVEGYMRMPAIQYPLLRLRTIVLSYLGIRSSMETGPDMGLCRVVYEASPKGFIIKIDGRSIMGHGRLFMLNEVDGGSFDRLITDGNSMHAFEIPAWKKVALNTMVASRELNIGFSLTPGVNEDSSSFHVYCGREVAFDLNWAGLAITKPHPTFTYMVDVRAVKIDT
jgi:hypothetical protein